MPAKSPKTVLLELLHGDRLRAAAERRAAHDTAVEAPPRAAADMRHELDVYRIELEMQNEQLRETQVALEAARDRYIDLYDFAPLGYLTLNPRGTVTEANLTSARLLGVDRARLVGSRFARHVAPADRDRWYRHALALGQRAGPSRIELTLRGPEERSFDAQLDGVISQAAGAEPMLRIAVTDISERKRADAELRVAAAAFETQEGIMITDAQGVVERVNQAFTRITGYGAAEVVGRAARLLHGVHHDAEFYAAMWRDLQRSGAWQGELWDRRKDGSLFPVWVTITAVSDAVHASPRYVATIVDIAQRKAGEEEIARLAFYDPLTGLPNRRLMKDRLHQALAASARHRRDGVLMFIDLDRFKDVNDTRGHDSGDRLLQQVAQRLSACVREVDTVARTGGDEFVVILAPDLGDPRQGASAQAEAAGQKILAALRRPYALGGQACHCSVSIGITLFSDHLATVDELLKRADQAMYQAKAAGRNTLRFFDSAIQQSLLSRATLEAELRQALERGELLLYYQPIVDQQRRVLGAEALVRWLHPRRGLVEPQEFITVAEQSGLIHALGRRVLETACAQLAAWAGDSDKAVLTLSVNISAGQLHDPGFVEQVLDVLERSGVEPSRLRLELTESMMLDDVEDSIAKMEALKAYGVGFALDDFGTGYASLSHLKRLPLEQLKVDQSFVRDMLTNPHDAAIARTVLQLGHSLGLTVVAEGVETEAQFETLAALGYLAFQGYLFDRPAPTLLQ